MTKNDNLRYSCQLALPGFSEASQEKLHQAKVLVVGVGGLGCPVTQYLAAAGIGTLGLVDFDTVSVSNLHRQILFTPDEVGQNKAEIAARKLKRQNPQIKVSIHPVKVEANNVLDLLADYDLIADCTDNFETRYLLNDACVLAGKPLVYGAIYQYEGQVAIWNVAKPDGSRSPHYRDLFPEANAARIPNCAEGGVIPTIAGIIGCLMANEVLKYFSGMGELLTGQLLIFDAFSMQSRKVKIGNTSKIEIKNLTETSEIQKLPAAELKANLVTGKYELIDVRTEEERTQFHIGGLHFPLAELEQNGKLLVEKSKPFVVYCGTGIRSESAVKSLQQLFPEGQFLSLQGGLKAWQEL